MNTTHRLSNRIRPGTELPAWIHEEIVKLENRLEDATHDQMQAAKNIRQEADRKKDRRLLGIAEGLERSAAWNPEFYERPRKDALVDKHAADWIMSLVPRMVSKTDQQILRHTATRLLAGPGKAAPEGETATQVMMREKEVHRRFGVSVSEMMGREFKSIDEVYLESLTKAPGFNIDASAALVLEAVVINGITVPVVPSGKEDDHE